MSAEQTLVSVLAGDWKAQDGSRLFIDSSGFVEKNHSPFPVQITQDVNGQFVFNGFIGELVSSDVLLWQSAADLQPTTIFTLWTRHTHSSQSSSALDSNTDFSADKQPQTELSILQHVLFRVATLSSIPHWLPGLLENLFAHVFCTVRVSKCGFVKLEFFDLFDSRKIRSVNASLDFFPVARGNFRLNLVFPDFQLLPLFPFRRISLGVSPEDEHKMQIREVYGLGNPSMVHAFLTRGSVTLGDDLILRPLTKEDAVQLFETVQNSSHLERFLSNFVKEAGGSLTRCKWALDVWERGSRLNQSLHLGLFQKEGKLFGVVHVDKKLFGCHRVAVVEYWLAACATGRGLAPLMVAASLQWARVALSVNLAQFDVHPDNEGSIRVLQKLGAQLTRQKKSKSLFSEYRLGLDEKWSILDAVKRPWLYGQNTHDKLTHVHFSVSTKQETLDDSAIRAQLGRQHKRRHSVCHVDYFGKEVATGESPGTVAHRMKIPMTGPGIALKQLVGNTSSAGLWFIVFIKEFDWNSPTRNAICALRRFLPGEGYYFGLDHVVSVVDLNQCDSADQRESLIARYKLSVDKLPQGRLLKGGRLIPFDGDLADTNAINTFLNFNT